MSHDTHFYRLNIQHLFNADVNCRYAYRRHYKANEIVYQKGSQPITIFIYLSGKLTLIGKKTQCLDVYPGELIGAHAHFASLCYAETLQFSSSGEMFVIQFDYFQKQLHRCFAYFEKISDCLLKRQRILTNLTTLPQDIGKNDSVRLNRYAAL